MTAVTVELLRPQGPNLESPPNSYISFEQSYIFRNSTFKMVVVIQLVKYLFMPLL